jgi:hypothetical protein
MPIANRISKFARAFSSIAAAQYALGCRIFSEKSFV